MKCSHCKTEKPVSEFYPSHRKHGGTCIECAKAINREREAERKKRAEPVKARMRALEGKMLVVRGFPERVLGDTEKL